MKTLIFSSVAILLITTTLLPNAAYSQSIKGKQGAGPANYVGASVGQATLNDFCDPYDHCDEGDQSWKVYSGVKLSEGIYLEGGYVNMAEQVASNDNGESLSAEISGYTTAAVVTYPVYPKIDVFGKAGLFFWENKMRTEQGQVDVDGTDIFVGAGASYDLGDNLGLRAEWERFEGLQAIQQGQTSMDLFSLGVTFSSL